MMELLVKVCVLKYLIKLILFSLVLTFLLETRSIMVDKSVGMTQPNKQLIVWGERILDPIFIFVCASWFKDTEWVVSSHLVSIKRI